MTNVDSHNASLILALQTQAQKAFVSIDVHGWIQFGKKKNKASLSTRVCPPNSLTNFGPFPSKPIIVSIISKELVGYSQATFSHMEGIGSSLQLYWLNPCTNDGPRITKYIQRKVPKLHGYQWWTKNNPIHPKKST